MHVYTLCNFDIQKIGQVARVDTLIRGIVPTLCNFCCVLYIESSPQFLFPKGPTSALAMIASTSTRASTELLYRNIIEVNEAGPELYNNTYGKLNVKHDCIVLYAIEVHLGGHLNMIWPEPRELKESSKRAT